MALQFLFESPWFQNADSQAIPAAAIGAIALPVVLTYLYLRAGKRTEEQGTRKIHRLPGTQPILKNTAEFLKNGGRLHDWITSHVEHFKGEPFIGEWLGNPPRVFITTPEAVEEVTKAKFNNFPKGETQLDKLRDVLGGGIFASDHAQWANQRKTAVNLFTV
ncbi:hypothetical protein Poli38472_014904 [Pythium oligandrum]|uniref:Cytochrome P450 n=1 Tax=Pythium oligandrum TaxID=41045 RepID=A0A8K1C7Y2_PYTOL|nr:hypothetical protein Poli38472_014890 [Pythium oligandrum]TMW57660.1 hypothetical protein Poli38472_014893 [Pythium oligandrum]TMW62742.1 hypothetical protein Poli38472_005360 [Pythium oligandrum]TMW62745.1 hypothetical protein Poli38472_005363 [Pythium oligandrum]TMW62748.1 hypothetical protein Poli38472_005366 [Pythium oligandrum]|eukprot:TMW57657.1 hypothetical protein Poli38472_014890 [Pythium oligandrum]